MGPPLYLRAPASVQPDPGLGGLGLGSSLTLGWRRPGSAAVCTSRMVKARDQWEQWVGVLAHCSRWPYT